MGAAKSRQGRSQLRTLLDLFKRHPTSMCLAVYVASETPLPESKWNEHEPAFYLQRVPESASVRRHFGQNHVYYAGSHEGCGCGFLKDGKDAQELELSERNYLALAAVLSPAIRGGANVQIFTCWEGEQTSKPEVTGGVTLEQLIGASFELQQLSLLELRHET